MIWVWLKLALVYLLRLFVPNPYPKPRSISPNRLCTVCGNPGGTLTFHHYQQLQKPERQPMVVFICSTCGFAEAFKPVGVPEFPVDLTPRD